MNEAVTASLARGDGGAVTESLAYIQLMTVLATDYTWAGAELYWLELQKDVKAGYHSMTAGSPWNARAFTFMQQRYPLTQAGRLRTALTSASSGTSPSSDSEKRKERSGNFVCSDHGSGAGHDSAHCRFLASQKAGGSSSSTKASPTK